MAFISFDQLTGDVRFMNRYVLAPVEGIANAMEQAAQFQTKIEDVRAGYVVDPVTMTRMNVQIAEFMARYRRDWAVAGNTSEDARRFRAELARAKRTDLIDEESQAMAAVERDVDHLRASLAAQGTGTEWTPGAWDDVRDLRTVLRQLLIVNMGYVKVALDAFGSDSEQTRTTMLIVGLTGLFLAVGLGIQVRQAIAPRIVRLVGMVRKFQEFGVHERVLERGRDEIAILANALDAGFAAIAARDRERERFLAIVAHELKTPMTTILGFTELALTHPEDAAVRARALELVRRQAGRLGRLIDDLLLAASARTGALPFRPQPTDLGSLVKKVIAEVEVAMPGRRFELEAREPVHLLADERLLAQAIWSALTYAAVITEPRRPMVIRMVRSGPRTGLEIVIVAPTVPASEIERSFEPFASVQYETGEGMRSAVGLSLCREIARLHGGSLHASNLSETERSLVMDLPS
jgi:signal transduction histidine kinase